MPCGVAGGYPPELAWWKGGVDQGPWLQERVGGGVGGDGSSKEGGGLGLGWLFQRGASPQPSENRGE